MAKGRLNEYDVELMEISTANNQLNTQLDLIDPLWPHDFTWSNSPDLYVLPLVSPQACEFLVELHGPLR